MSSRATPKPKGFRRTHWEIERIQMLPTDALRTAGKEKIKEAKTHFFITKSCTACTEGEGQACFFGRLQTPPPLVYARRHWN